MGARIVDGNSEANRRSERRRRVYKRARITFNNGYAAFDCIVRNVSSGGALLEMDTLAGIPHSFEIILQPDGKARSCRVVWRTERRMGVVFDGAEAPA